jgi:hypothetical protein
MFGLYGQSDYFCTRFKSKAEDNLPFKDLLPIYRDYKLKTLENKANLFSKRFGSPEKSTTFAAALRVKPGTDLLFILS